MSNITAKYLQNNCRICLKTGAVPIFGSDNLSDAIRTFGAIEINEHDGFPNLLCNSCHNLLQNAILFRKIAQQTDKELREPNIIEVEIEPLFMDVEEKPIAKSEGNFKARRSDTASKKHHCDRCNIEFDSWKSYCIHAKSDEHIKRKLKCPVCNQFYFSFYIKKHILRHRLNPEQAFVCDVCGKSFAILGAFKRHKAIHTHEFPFKCDLCPYRGRFSHSLKLHKRKHTGEKRHVCMHCGTRFVSTSNLSRHMLQHKTVRDYKCDDCSNGYYTKKDLEIHIKVIHSGIKDHACDTCGKGFATRKHMMRHQLRVHKREAYPKGRVPLYLLQAQKNNSKEENTATKSNV